MTRTHYRAVDEGYTTYYAIPIPDDVSDDEVDDYIADNDLDNDANLLGRVEHDDYYYVYKRTCDDADPTRPHWAGGDGPTGGEE